MFGQYTLHQKISDGGYSSVYKCTDSIGIRYACKQLPKEKNKRLRVVQEVYIMKILSHSPKIVKWVDAGEDEKNYYIVQELCRGGSVQEYVKNYPDYGENTVASIVRGTLRGLCHMHEKGIIHCDIKAGNIFLGDTSEDADVKIGDLGTAILTKMDTIEVDDLIGTPWFMAPENLSYQYHTKSDIWSVGVMCYQLLSGKLPFNDKEMPSNPSLAKIWRSILHEEPNMTGYRWEKISEDAKDFIKTCLVKDYKNRITARESLQHPWLTKTDCNDRFKGTPLQCEPFKYENEAKMYAKTISGADDLV
jgi:calcium-dependent protein kinase